MSLLEKLFHLRGLTGNRPAIDQHGLFTSIQMSNKLLSEKLAVKEPWRQNKKPHQCRVCLYTNDSSPFVVCYDSSGHKPRARIELFGTKVVTCGENSFKLCNEEGSDVYFFETDGRLKRDEWVKALREQCERELSPDGEESVRLSKKIMEVRQRVKSQKMAELENNNNNSKPLKTLPVTPEDGRQRSVPHLKKNARLAKRRPHIEKAKKEAALAAKSLPLSEYFVSVPDS
ncbi:hypothetical protein Bbelb_013710 [Branchiostoma belcheri]|nr:hypothetical protein Bbelb_013710 [Branchiostoma belcheri]